MYLYVESMVGGVGVVVSVSHTARSICNFYILLSFEMCHNNNVYLEAPIHTLPYIVASAIARADISAIYTCPHTFVVAIVYNSCDYDCNTLVK